MCNELKQNLLNFNELIEFENTKTFQYLKNQRFNKKYLREPFLSISPYNSLKNKSKIELIKILNNFNNIQELFKNDFHLLTILNNHKIYLNNFLKI